jgi:hypothetical protein
VQVRDGGQVFLMLDVSAVTMKAFEVRCANNYWSINVSAHPQRNKLPQILMPHVFMQLYDYLDTTMLKGSFAKHGRVDGMAMEVCTPIPCV